ncbi:hypothetical protein EC968_007571 [Mortierella alpina]|nr:hypothetical protein EC968_007571 [Mortierella alpina]
MKLQWFLPVPGLWSNVPDMILIAEEFSSLMIELATLRNAHTVSAAGDEVQEVSSSAVDTQQRALALRVQGMGLANEYLARNTKEQYIIYLRLFRDFCNNTYAHENDLRYEVSEDKVLVFFKDIMFERRTPKVFRPGDTKDVRMAVALLPSETRAVRRVVDLRVYLEDVQPEADNTKILYGPCEGATMDQALKALVHLQSRQINRIDNPSTAPPLRRSKAIKEILLKYSNDLVYGELVNHRNWSASCTVRNTYSIDEHIRCLLDSWQQPVSASSPSAKLHLSLAMRHAMMLRDDDVPATNVTGGTQNLVYLVFAF